ncbi:MAG: branched-chain amino acid ABC transporter substrate-binding protein [Candidatus Dormibacteraceae bacterium]
MRTHRIGSTAAVAAVGVLALAGCGSNGPSPGSSPGTANKGTISIGVDLPQSGAEASDGIPTLNGIKFAVSQQGTLDGYTLQVVNKDDAPTGKHDPTVGANNVRALIADSSVLGMIGPFNSNVAKVEIPIANSASLPMISPANTNPCLTKNLPDCSLPGGYHPADLRPTGVNNYFRVAATDDHQGGAMADYAYKVLGIKQIGVVDDNEVYGKGIADAFASRFKTDGGTIAGGSVNDVDTASESSFAALIDRMKSGGATAVYFGGTSSTKGCVIRNQMSSNGMPAASNQFLGGDGIVDAECLKDAGDQAANMFGTVASADATKIPAAQATITAFKAAYPNPADYGAYTIPAYSATKILIAAIDKAIKAKNGGLPTRKEVLAQVAKTSNVSTPLGPVSFNSLGDTSQQIISIYKSVTTGSSTPLTCSATNKQVCWVFVKQVNFSS